MLISCHQVKKSFGDKNILNGIDLDIVEGDRIGLVGRNGAGKTTLANILAGVIDYEEGTIIKNSDKLNIAYLRQTGAESEVLLNVLDGEIASDSELQRMASQLGIKRIREWSPENYYNLSGGEKTKLALAAIWAARPHLVILDEPTNHLDYQGVACLTDELKRFPGAAIIISHDRYFLDSTVTQVAEIEKGKINIYPGNYSAYREAKLQERESQWHLYQSQQKEQRKIDDTIEKLKKWSEKAHRESRRKGQGMGGKEYFRKKAKKRDQAIKSQLKRLEKMRKEGVLRPVEDPRIILQIDAGRKGGRRLLEAESISKSFGKLILFQDSYFYINRGEKTGILGPNGCGKTTLVKTMLGQESLDEGNFFLSPAVRVAYISQELPQNEKESLTDFIKDWPLERQKSAFQLLVSLGIDYDRLEIALGKLSRGERMKIAIGLATMGEYDLLILDEPTNHLDIFSREALEECLIRFSGSILLISHDRYLLDRICDCLLVFDSGRVMRYEGKVSEYLASPNINRDSRDSGEKTKKINFEQEILLVETRISWLLNELNCSKPGEPRYIDLDREYKDLLQKKLKLKQEQQKLKS